jgi:hypothetical protein
MPPRAMEPNSWGSTFCLYHKENWYRPIRAYPAISWNRGLPHQLEPCLFSIGSRVCRMGIFGVPFPLLISQAFAVGYTAILRASILFCCRVR